MKKIAVILMALSLIGFVVTGCAPAEEGGTTTTTGGEKKEPEEK